MKYIRTQAGVYEVKNGKFLRDWSLDVEKYSRDFPARFADTIEELCDEFVYEERLICKSRLKQTCEMLLKEKADIYGAIWTDNGLIYVAKMNQEGELELWQD